MNADKDEMITILALTPCYHVRPSDQLTRIKRISFIVSLIYVLSQKTMARRRTTNVAPTFCLFFFSFSVFCPDLSSGDVWFYNSAHDNFSPFCIENREELDFHCTCPTPEVDCM